MQKNNGLTVYKHGLKDNLAGCHSNLDLWQRAYFLVGLKLTLQVATVIRTCDKEYIFLFDSKIFQQKTVLMHLVVVEGNTRWS